MKQTIITTISSLFFLTSNAQVEVTSKSFDLESQNKHKNWSVGEASIEPATGKVSVKMIQAFCDAEADVTRSFTTITTEYTFKGVEWNIDNLIFDPNYNFLETKSKKYKDSEEALLNGENIYGKKYNARIGGTIIGAAFGGLAMPKSAIDNSFMFTNIVTGTSGMTGFKVAVSYIGLKVEGAVSKTAGISCSEFPAVYKVSIEDAKEEKGQRWIPMYNNPVPNGGNVLFNTVGVIKEEKQHYIFRKYDKNANIIKEQTFTFDYQCILNGKEIEKAPGEFDYIFIATPINYKKSKMPLAPANSYEYFYVDGNTYEIKEKLTIVAPNSQWLVNHVIRDNGATYLVGTCGEKSTEYADIFSVPKLDAYENTQVVKIENGKLVYAKSTMNNDLKPAFKTIDGLKSNSSINFYMPFATLNLKNGKLIYSGQQEYGSIKGALQTIIFDGNGKVEAILSKQEKTIARSHLSFSKDNKKLFWLLEDVEKYNEINNLFTLTPKKAREVITSLSVLTYDLETNNISKFQNLENEEWAVNYKNPILMDSENTIIMLGNKITKKAKESEITFITLKK